MSPELRVLGRADSQGATFNSQLIIHNPPRFPGNGLPQSRARDAGSRTAGLKGEDRVGLLEKPPCSIQNRAPDANLESGRLSHDIRRVERGGNGLVPCHRVGASEAKPRLLMKQRVEMSIRPAGEHLFPELLANTEPVDNGAITAYILRLQVVQEPPPLADHLQKTPAGVVILRMDFEMSREVADPLTQKCDLDFRRARISYVPMKGIDYFRFPLSVERQAVLHAIARNNLYYRSGPGHANMICICVDFRRIRPGRLPLRNVRGAGLLHGGGQGHSRDGSALRRCIAFVRCRRRRTHGAGAGRTKELGLNLLARSALLRSASPALLKGPT